jgi:hypothetical protein
VGRARTPNQPSQPSERGRSQIARSILADVGHARHNSEELVPRYRQVIMETGVAARDDPDAVDTQCAADESVHDDMTVAHECHDLAGLDVREIHQVNGDRITGPNRRQHAGPANAKAQWSAGGERASAQGDFDRKMIHPTSLLSSPHGYFELALSPSACAHRIMLRGS